MQRVAAASCVLLAAADGLRRTLLPLQVLDAAAGVYAYEDFLTEDECEHLIALAEPRLGPSGVVATHSNGTGACAHLWRVMTRGDGQAAPRCPSSPCDETSCCAIVG
jgi:hypothetical protein